MKVEKRLVHFRFTFDVVLILIRGYHRSFDIDTGVSLT
jgi:hypothetical protein